MNNRTGKGVLAAALVLGLLLLVGLTSKPAGPSSPVRTATSPIGSDPARVLTGLPVGTPTSTSGAPLRGRSDRKEIDQQDRYLRTGRAEHRLRQEYRGRPGYQHLPYRTEKVRIEITNVTSDGRIVLTIIPLGLNVNPRLGYRGFLARYHDPGSGYLPRFARYGS